MLRIAMILALGYLVVGGDAQAAECRQADPAEWGACVSAEVARLKPAMTRAEKLIAASANRQMRNSKLGGDWHAARVLRELRNGTASPRAKQSDAFDWCSLSGCTEFSAAETEKIVAAVGEPALAGSLRTCLSDVIAPIAVYGCTGRWKAISAWASHVRVLTSVAGDIPALAPGAGDAYAYDLSMLRQSGLWPEPGVTADFYTPAYNAITDGGQAYLQALKTYLDGRDIEFVQQLHKDLAAKPAFLF